jgi:hypothetical protein
MPADEDITDGSCCSICYSYFKNSIKWLAPKTNDVFVHGYPVACQDCFDNNRKKAEKMNLQKTVIDNFF